MITSPKAFLKNVQASSDSTLTRFEDGEAHCLPKEAQDRFQLREESVAFIQKSDDLIDQHTREGCNHNLPSHTPDFIPMAVANCFAIEKMWGKS
ncbi:unnamed protein product [Camellia sinensis]